ncbi:hypothetical protein C8A03DRAFT_37689 [Achaetomium macrosporum]|uniref:Uncharacterized protein n=1 Tax=Achaetomium macrosporum TaxID=79813 RepID=A0AAN7C372_9PEZI|nr:hypothetical protein C8A03DRAFT_37689 [Achaetomium macrosporum]
MAATTPAPTTIAPGSPPSGSDLELETVSTGIILPSPPDKLQDCHTDEQKTAWVVAQLKLTPYNEVLDLIDRFKDVKRFFLHKTVRKDGELQPVTFKLNTQPRAKSFALLLFTKRENKTRICKQCTSSKSQGPHDQCMQPDLGYGKGACTNCIYSGRGTECSLRLEIEEQEAQLKRAQGNKPPKLTARICRFATDRELERWLMLVKEELGLRAVEKERERHR